MSAREPALPSTISVAVVDDNVAVRAVLRQMLDDGRDFSVVGEAADGLAALDLVLVRRPQVTLLDHRMPVRDGLSVVSALARTTRVLMLTRTEDDAVIVAAIRAGAAGFLIHGQFGPAELASAIREVAEGAAHLSPGAAKVVVDSLRRAGRAGFGLSRREQEVMDLIADGWSNGEISRQLFLSPKTIENHVHSIFGKLRATSRSAAIEAWRGR
jgi:DNA-binding NarL/FixJ family response regulator